MIGLDSLDLANFAGRVSDSGEGRWTIAAVIEGAIPPPVLSAALYERITSRGEGEFAKKVSVFHYQFGGYDEKDAADKAGA
jgi:6-phosphogluconate dehydrogenase